MAGDWIKMRSDLFTHPKVVRMSSALKADTLRTVGGLMSAWCLFDAHSIDGQLSGYTPEFLDSHLRWAGFSEAMAAVGWLEFDADNGLSLPRFDTHNGQSAKRRAQDADRKRDVRKTSAPEADKKRTREEKRREEKTDTADQPDGFDSFWKAYPKKAAKPAALKAFRSAKINGHLPEVLADVESRSQSDDWMKEDGKYVPNPATYLNQRRWEDQKAPTSPQIPGLI